MALDQRPDVRLDEPAILAKLSKDSVLLQRLDTVSSALLGPDLRARFGDAGRRFALAQTARLVSQLAPDIVDLPSERARTEMTKHFVLALHAWSSSTVSVEAALSEGNALSARTLAYQLLARSPDPNAWVEPLAALRRGETGGIRGQYPGLGADAFNVLLVTVLASDVAAMARRTASLDA